MIFVEKRLDISSYNRNIYKLTESFRGALYCLEEFDETLNEAVLSFGIINQKGKFERTLHDFFIVDRNHKKFLSGEFDLVTYIQISYVYDKMPS